MNKGKTSALFLLDHASFDRIYGEEERADISRLAAAPPPLLTVQTWREQPEVSHTHADFLDRVDAYCATLDPVAAADILENALTAFAANGASTSRR